MGLATDVIFLVLSSVNNDLHIYVFATDCEVRDIGRTELNNVSYISDKVTWTINFSDKETLMLRLKIWVLRFLGASKYLT